MHASINPETACTTVRRLLLSTASVTAEHAARDAVGSEIDDSHCLVFATRIAASPGASMYGGSMPIASLATAKHASAISRSPPSEARPACDTIALNRKTGVSRAYGGAWIMSRALEAI